MPGAPVPNLPIFVPKGPQRGVLRGHLGAQIYIKFVKPPQPSPERLNRNSAASLLHGHAIYQTPPFAVLETYRLQAAIF